MDDVELEVSEGQSEVLVDRVLWQAKEQAKSVQGPHIVVLGAFPDLLDGQTLSVVHATFLRIVADDWQS